MMTETDSERVRLETADELADHLGELPEPSEDPTEKYVHPGKEYELMGSDGSFSITALYPEGPGGGVVEFEMNGDRIAVSEHERGDGGIKASVMEPFVPEDAARGVITVSFLMVHVRELQVSERDLNSYADLFWNWMDAREREVSA